MDMQEWLLEMRRNMMKEFNSRFESEVAKRMAQRLNEKKTIDSFKAQLTSAVPLPDFMFDDPDFWLAIVEQQFKSARITSEEWKYTHLVAILPKEIMQRAKGVVLKGYQSGSYDELKIVISKKHRFEAVNVVPLTTRASPDSATNSDVTEVEVHNEIVPICHSGYDDVSHENNSIDTISEICVPQSDSEDKNKVKMDEASTTVEEKHPIKQDQSRAKLSKVDVIRKQNPTICSTINPTNKQQLEVTGNVSRTSKIKEDGTKRVILVFSRDIQLAVWFDESMVTMGAALHQLRYSPFTNQIKTEDKYVPFDRGRPPEVLVW